MRCQLVTKTFKVVEIKGEGAFSNFGAEVPELAQQFLQRIKEVGTDVSMEIALYEPKRKENQQKGHYFVGVIVNEAVKSIPKGMRYIQIDKQYVMARGNLNEIGSIHEHLLKWAEQQGYTRDLSQYIVETYHPMENSEEEVSIYLPIYL